MTYITVKVKRDDEYQEFKYSGDLNIPITTLLDKLDIKYTCSCLQGLCGSCAMVINSKPKLACKTFLSDELKLKNNIIIEPLSKFPIIKDLKVDKSKLYDDLKDCEVWLEDNAKINEDIPFEYEMSLCLMCGCCVEACPNYDLKEFVGTPIAVLSSKVISQEQDKSHLKKLKQQYNKKFYSHCVKSLSCEEVCPMGIETQRAISKLNKKAVWILRQFFNRD